MGTFCVCWGDVTTAGPSPATFVPAWLCPGAAPLASPAACRARSRGAGPHEGVLITPSCTEQLGHELWGQQWEAVKLH